MDISLLFLDSVAFIDEINQSFYWLTPNWASYRFILIDSWWIKAITSWWAREVYKSPSSNLSKWLVMKLKVILCDISVLSFINIIIKLADSVNLNESQISKLFQSYQINRKVAFILKKVNFITEESIHSFLFRKKAWKTH